MGQLRAFLRMILLVLIIMSLLILAAAISLQEWLLARRAPYLRARICRWHCRLIVLVCGIEVEGVDKLRAQLGRNRSLILSNHVNYLDILVLGSVVPMGFVAKQEVGDWPILGAMFRCYNTIFVQREDINSRFRCIRQLQQNSRILSYCVFPQGTTSLTPYLTQDQAWYSGQIVCVKDPGTKLVAVGISYDDHEAMAWVDDMSLLPHLWLVLSRKSLAVAVESASVAFEGQALRQLSTGVRDRINLLCERASSNISEKKFMLFRELKCNDRVV